MDPPQATALRNGPAAWSKRVWTGSATIEVSVFKHTETFGASEIISYSTAAKRLWKVGDTEKGSRSFRPEDLLPLARLLGQAFDFVSAQR